jgi:short-subunit dehydrogenase
VLRLDITDPESVAAAAAATDVTLLVNNAGSAGAGGLISWSWRNLRAVRPT